MWNRLETLLRIRAPVYSSYTAGVALCLVASGCQVLELNRLTVPEPEAALTTVDASWSPLTNDFGSVLTGSNSANQTFTLTNNGTGAATGCSAPAISNTTDFTIMTDLCGTNDLALGGATCAVEVRANPNSTGVKTATLSRTCTTGGTVSTTANLITVTGTGPSLAWSPLSNAFGNVLINTNSSSATFTLTNSGTANATGCSAPSLSNTTDFSIVTDNCTTADVASGGGTCTVDVRANPTTTGAKTATLSRVCTVGGTPTTTANLITATGTAPSLAWSPLSNAFGNVLINTNSSSVTFTLTNSGTANATGCSAPSLSNTTDFSIVTDNCTTANVASGGGTCTVDVRANPTTTGAKTATLSRTCTVGGTPTTTTNLITTTGFSVTLAWSPLTKAFGNIEVGTNSSSQTFTLTNTGTGDASGCAAPSLSNTTDFSIATDNCTTANVTSGGGTCTVDVQANPASTGAKTATLSRVCTIGGTASTTTNMITTTGANVSLAWTPLTKNFGTTLIGANSTSQTFTLTNSGGVNATGCSAPSLSDTTNFTIVTDNCTTANVTSGGGTCTVDVRANPISSGAKTATLSRVCTAGGTVTTTTNGLTVTAPPVGLAFTTQPANIIAGQTFSPDIVVQAESSPGILDSTYTGSITLSLNVNNIGTVGTLTRSAVAGVATFTSLGVTTIANALSLNASVGGYVAKVSNSFNVTANSPTQLSWGDSTTNRPVNSCMGPFNFMSKDAYGNPSAVSSLVSVNLTSNSSGSGLFYSTTDCSGGNITSINIASSSYLSGSFYFKNNVAESLTLTADAGGGSGLSLATKAITVNPTTANTWSANTATGVPGRRFEHCAVWTGTEMIVWGGRAEDGDFISGSRYNPATNSWTGDTSTTGAPTARYGASAIWTGTEMIVWGGSTGATGGRYNPATDTWGTAIQTTGAPSSRRYHSAVWTGTEMIVWGGEPGTLSGMNTGGRYNPATDTWGNATTTTGAPSARYGHVGVWTGSEMIIWGGNVGSATNTGGRYNPLTDSWGTATTTTGAPSARYYTAGAWTGTEMLVWGGFGGTNTGGRYNPATDTWGTAIQTTGRPASRYSLSAIWTGSEMIVWGGTTGTLSYNSGGRYDPATDSWGAAPQTSGAPTPRYHHSAVWTGTEMIVWGGYDGYTGAYTHTNTGKKYTPANDAWGASTTTTGAPSGRYGHSAVWTGSEMIIWGGVNGMMSTRLDTGGRYTPGTDTWGTATQTTGAPSARYAHSAVWTGTEMIVWGGTTGSLTNTGGRYTPGTDTWGTATQTTGAPSARYAHSAVWSGSEMIIWGGQDGSPTNTGGRYTPGTDTWGTATQTTGAPSARFYHSAVWTGTEMIVWGGTSSGSSTNTGGRYTPGTDAWGTATQTTGAPAARNRHSAVWTGSEMIIWGGVTSGSNFVNTGAFYAP